MNIYSGEKLKMSKLSNAINMVILLQIYGKMTIRELSEKLEVSSKMIRQYKQDLEMAGIYINSDLGREGGYYIDAYKRIDYLGISDSELTALKMASETIKSGKFHYADSIENLLNKIIVIHESNQGIHYYNKMRQEIDEINQHERKLWNDLNTLIIAREKIEISYKALKREGIQITNRIIHPYGVFDYKGASYVYGFCERAQAIRMFKLSRVVSYRLTNEQYEVDQKFSFKQILDQSFGIYNDSVQKIVLKIYYPMSEIIKEKVISKNQKIEQIDDKTILFEAEMSGYEEYKNWILGMGLCVEVIKPQSLRDDLFSEINKMLMLYKK